MKTDQALKEYLVHIQVNESKSPRTVSSYINDLNQYIAWLKTQKIYDTEKIRPKHVQAFIIEQKQTIVSPGSFLYVSDGQSGT